MLCYLFGVNFSQLYISEYSLYQEKMIKDKVEKKKIINLHLILTWWHFLPFI